MHVHGGSLPGEGLPGVAIDVNLPMENGRQIVKSPFERPASQPASQQAGHEACVQEESTRRSFDVHMWASGQSATSSLDQHRPVPKITK